MDDISTKANDENVDCITQHPGFAVNCLEPWVLKLAAAEFIQEVGPLGDDEPVHEYVPIEVQ